MEVIFIGTNFYFESGTCMSSVYEIVANHYERTDWGKIQVALELGNTVNIRPATEGEIKQFMGELIRLKKELSKTGT